MLNDTGFIKRAPWWKPEERVKGERFHTRLDDKRRVLEKCLGPEGLGGKGSKPGNVASPVFSDSSLLPLASEIRMFPCSGRRRGTSYQWVLRPASGESHEGLVSPELCSGGPAKRKGKLVPRFPVRAHAGPAASVRSPCAREAACDVSLPLVLPPSPSL